jgi:hypothetical protein
MLSIGGGADLRRIGPPTARSEAREEPPRETPYLEWLLGRGLSIRGGHHEVISAYLPVRPPAIEAEVVGRLPRGIRHSCEREREKRRYFPRFGDEGGQGDRVERRVPRDWLECWWAGVHECLEVRGGGGREGQETDSRLRAIHASSSPNCILAAGRRGPRRGMRGWRAPRPSRGVPSRPGSRPSVISFA